MLNVVAIMGRLVADPELRTTPQGINVCSFRIACDRNFACFRSSVRKGRGFFLRHVTTLCLQNKVVLVY